MCQRYNVVHSVGTVVTASTAVTGTARIISDMMAGAIGSEVHHELRITKPTVPIGQHS